MSHTFRKVKNNVAKIENKSIQFIFFLFFLTNVSKMVTKVSKKYVYQLLREVFTPNYPNNCNTCLLTGIWNAADIKDTFLKLRSQSDISVSFNSALIFRIKSKFLCFSSRKPLSQRLDMSRSLCWSLSCTKQVNSSPAPVTMLLPCVNANPNCSLMLHDRR